MIGSGGEYLSHEFDKHLKSCGIVSQLTELGTPQHNGVSERRNRTLLDMVRSMMCRTNLPHSFWSFALETATRIVNLAPTKKVDKTPYEIWHGEKPNVSYLRVWGCDAYISHESPNKLDLRGDDLFSSDTLKQSIRISTILLKTRFSLEDELPS